MPVFIRTDVEMKEILARIEKSKTRDADLNVILLADTLMMLGRVLRMPFMIRGTNTIRKLVAKWP